MHFVPSLGGNKWVIFKTQLDCLKLRLDVNFSQNEIKYKK